VRLGRYISGRAAGRITGGSGGPGSSDRELGGDAPRHGPHTHRRRLGNIPDTTDIRGQANESMSHNVTRK
jgi:hypothetical protein